MIPLSSRNGAFLINREGLLGEINFIGLASNRVPETKLVTSNGPLLLLAPQSGDSTAITRRERASSE